MFRLFKNSLLFISYGEITTKSFQVHASEKLDSE